MISKKNFAIAFDVDGVLVYGQSKAPSGTEALKLLNKYQIPYVLLSNSSGNTEDDKAAMLSKITEVPLNGNQVILANTPMKALVGKYKNSPILLVGKERSIQVLRLYGFENIIFIDDYSKKFPFLFPSRFVNGIPKNDAMQQHSPPSTLIANDIKIEAILVTESPLDWWESLQIICDVVRTNGTPQLHKTVESFKQQVPIYFSNPDINYKDEYILPRMTLGSFRKCLEVLYKEETGDNITYTIYGKPFETMFKYAEIVLEKNIRDSGTADEIKTIYMIGDNPKSDICGANAAGPKWYSILTRSGVFQGDNDSTYPAKYVCDNALQAVEFILRRESIEIS